MDHRKAFLLILLIFFAISSCNKKAEDARFSAPGKSYAVWLKTAVEGDYAANIECVTKASVKFMDSQAKFRMVFMERMTQAAQGYSNFSVTSEKIKGDKAVVIITDPESGNSIAIPFQYEDGGWKVDLIAMFGGAVRRSN